MSVFSTRFKPANSKFESLTDLQWALFAKFRQRREAIETNKGYTGTSYKNIIVPCPGLKKSTMPCPDIPLATDFSWIVKDGQIRSEHCTVPPAPETLLALCKCGCTKGCKNKICSCKKSCQPCTDLCDCGDNFSNQNNTVEDIIIIIILLV